ncbi:MAG: 4-hydroxy-tetrahydrodipicolinate reductase [Elusimicrobiota bacterium]
MLKLTVCGACGKMGKMIIDRILTDNELKLVGAVEKKGHPFIEQMINKIKITDNIETVIKNTDVVIDFTNPEATLEHLGIAIRNVVAGSCPAFVIGTTGISEKGLEKIKEVSNTCAIVFSPNMSAGVNLLFKLVDEVAGVLSNYDVEIVEAHHNQKKDAPSGTAVKIADIISGKLKLSKIYGRTGITGPRKKEIGIHAVRAGDIVGEHTVIFAGSGERLELIHRAHSRETFAAGAVKAAKWIFSKKPGLYSMQDVLGL